MRLTSKLRAGAVGALIGSFIVAGSLFVPGPAGAVPVTKYCVEHTQGNGTVDYIVVDQGALQGHAKHGDRSVQWDGVTCDVSSFDV